MAGAGIAVEDDEDVIGLIGEAVDELAKGGEILIRGERTRGLKRQLDAVAAGGAREDELPVDLLDVIVTAGGRAQRVDSGRAGPEVQFLDALIGSAGRGCLFPLASYSGHRTLQIFAAS